VVDPDGTLRVVRYTADDVNGFQAEVVKNGISAIHEPSSDDGNVKEEGENDNKKGGGGKKKDYDDDEEDEDGDDDDYDDSDELEDYDEAVKKNKGSDESDEYY
uniref:Uncharacterized protein n=1 Tax=Musca domestica TaxID=7370 RepID=A0A1I8NF55_MUSDO